MKGNLLIVDDEPLLLDSLQFLLRNVCEHIFVAANGEEAIKIINEQKIDCVLTDYHMPKMSGLELFKIVRQTNSNLPFIFYTGHGVEKIEGELSTFKHYEVIDKPSFDRVPELVKNFIDDTYLLRSFDVL